MRTIKSLFMVLVAVLLSVSIASAAATTTANGTTKIKPSVTDGVISVVVFDDVNVASKKKTYYSNPIEISGLDFTRGSNRDTAYMAVGWAHANTATTSTSDGDVTVTYQLSPDGLNFYTPKWLAGTNTAVEQGYLGIFGTSSTDGFDYNEGAGNKDFHDNNVDSTIAYGAGPYCPTNTKVVEVTLTQAKYIRFQVSADTTGSVIGDLFFMGAARQDMKE